MTDMEFLTQRPALRKVVPWATKVTAGNRPSPSIQICNINNFFGSGDQKLKPLYDDNNNNNNNLDQHDDNDDGDDVDGDVVL
jgi:hypothetical protein